MKNPLLVLCGCRSAFLQNDSMIKEAFEDAGLLLVRNSTPLEKIAARGHACSKGVDADHLLHLLRINRRLEAPRKMRLRLQQAFEPGTSSCLKFWATHQMRRFRRSSHNTPSCFYLCSDVAQQLPTT